MERTDFVAFIVTSVCIWKKIDPDCYMDNHCKTKICEDGICAKMCEDENDCLFGSYCVKNSCRSKSCEKNKDCGLRYVHG